MFMFVYIRMFAQEIQHLPRKKNPAMGIEPTTSRSGKLRFPDNSSSSPLSVCQRFGNKILLYFKFLQSKRTVYIKRYKY